MTREFIGCDLPLVYAVTRWLAGRANKTPAGVPALDHLLVFVPTRQAGRRLRETLAEHFNTGCIPPRIMLPSQFLQPEKSAAKPLPNEGEQLAVLCKLLFSLDFSRYPALFPANGSPPARSFKWALAQAGQLFDIWRTLSEGALTMKAVAMRIESLLEGEDLDIEVERWSDLAALETEYFNLLAELHFNPPPLALAEKVASPAVPDGCTEIILPALTDAIPAFYAALRNLPGSLPVTLLIQADEAIAAGFNADGIPDPAFWLGAAAPRIDIPDAAIEQHADSTAQADSAAAYFASIADSEELPALGMVDAELFREIQSAFLARNIPVHNPAGFPLRSSSLARLIQQTMDFSADAPYPILAAFIRQDDVARWLKQRNKLSETGYALLLHALDTLQNRHLPQSVGQVQDFIRKEITALETKTKLYTDELRLREGLAPLLQSLQLLLDLTHCDPAKPRLDHLADVLKEIFSLRTLSDEHRKDRELGAAARATLELIANLDTPVTGNMLTPSQRDELFNSMLRSGTYQLEPPPGCLIQTEGWVELPWNPASELIITGFNEGCVPESLVGHPFLPDSLRSKLGLSCNDLKAARDTCILYTLITSRRQGAVRILLERANASGDVRKPSRLLFLCDDATLAARASWLFSENAQLPRSHAKSLPPQWRFNPPKPAPRDVPDSLSVTRIGVYLRCPFTFFLSDILNMKRVDDRAVEMDSMTFGNLCHHAIELFSRSSLKNSTDPDEIFQMLRAEVERECASLFGEAPPAVILLQLNAARQRLLSFARVQAERTSGGWMIVAVEERFTRRFLGIEIVGRVDRIDYNPKFDKLQVIDFKTWDKPGEKNGTSRFLTASVKEVEYALQRGIKTFEFEPAGKKKAVLTDMQLPLYLLMMPDTYRRSPQTSVECGYFVLGQSQEETCCVCHDFNAYTQCIQDTMDKLVSDIKEGIFWPPSPRKLWRNDYGHLFLEGPEETAPDWISDQEARIARMPPSSAAQSL